jgi:hypothetical protein
MAYLLKGRELPDKWSDDVERPCIFCGRVVKHVNGGGTACIVNGLDDHNEPQGYFYCNEGQCPQIKADQTYEKSIWRCGCCDDYIENIGATCVECGSEKARPQAVNGEPQNMVSAAPMMLVSKFPLTDDDLRVVMGAMDECLGSSMALFTPSDCGHLAVAESYCVEDFFSDSIDIGSRR